MNEVLNLLIMGLLTWAGRTIYVLSVRVEVLSKIVARLERQMDIIEKRRAAGI